jgi:DNA repair photolyase
MGTDLKIINQLGLNDTLIVLEPSRKCVARCVFCYVDLNHKLAAARGKPRPLEAPDSFSRHVNRAFGPDYDPTDFLQHALHERLVISWASGVEPWQDAAQARAILDVADRLDLPLFIQTRGTNWREVWPQVLARAGQIALYVSMPSPDPAYIKRYEPGTPPPSEREAMIRAAAEAGIPVMLSLAPFHPDWCADIPGYVRTAVEEWGVKGVFFDPLHLNRDQLSVAGDKTLAGLVETTWTDRGIAQLAEARALVVGRGLSWYTPTWKAPIHRLETSDPFGWLTYRNARRFGYHDEAIFEAVHPLIEADDAPPLLVTWEAALAAMEAPGAIAQRFSWRSLGQPIIGGFTRPGKHPSGGWLERLKGPAGATVADYLRGYWNNPRAGGFFWRHAFVRLAVKPDGSPRLTPSGDALAVFDVNTGTRCFERIVDDPAALDQLTLDGGSFVRRPWSER